MEEYSNRIALVEMIKQFLVIIVSLGLASAFMILGNLTRRIDQWDLIILFIYSLICTRFLLGNWLYLSNLSEIYKNPKTSSLRPHIRCDAAGLFITGIVLGLQGNYAGVDEKFDPFFLTFMIILLVNVIAWFASFFENRKWLSADTKYYMKYYIKFSIINDGFFFLFFIFIIFLSRVNPDPKFYLYLGGALLNSIFSLRITIRGYFKLTHPRPEPVLSAKP